MLVRLILGALASKVLLDAIGPKRWRVFVSYDHSEDSKYRYLMDAWNQNPDFDFEFDRTSPDIPVASRRAAVVRGVLTRKLKEADVLLVLIGRKTAQSRWVAWEIERALEEDVDLPIVGVKLGPFKAPPEMRGVGAIWVNRFTRDGILEALDRAMQR